MNSINKIFIFVLALLFITKESTSNAYGDNSVRKINMYLVSWNTSYAIVPQIKNIKKRHCFFFTTKNNDLFLMFDNYKDCVEKLKSQPTIEKKQHICNAYVELFFGLRKVSVYFCITGDYYFDGQWHRINYGLYYYIFQYFSNYIVSEELLKKAKANTNNFFWQFEEN